MKWQRCPKFKFENPKVKLPAHSAGPFDRAHGPEYVEWASRKGDFFYMVPLDPAYPARTGHLPVRCQMNDKFQGGILKRVQNDILGMPNRILNLLQDLTILVSLLNFGFDLKFEVWHF